MSHATDGPTTIASAATVEACRCRGQADDEHVVITGYAMRQREWPDWRRGEGSATRRWLAALFDQDWGSLLQLPAPWSVRLYARRRGPVGRVAGPPYKKQREDVALLAL